MSPRFLTASLYLSTCLFSILQSVWICGFFSLIFLSSWAVKNPSWLLSLNWQHLSQKILMPSFPDILSDNTNCLLSASCLRLSFCGGVEVVLFILTIINHMDNHDELRQSKAFVLSSKPHFSEVITKVLFYFHLVLSFTYCTVTVALHPFIVTRSMTFGLVVGYGFMLAWVLVAHMVLFCFGKLAASILVVRVLVKIVLAMWPLVGGIAYSRQHYLFLKELKYWMIYMTAFTVGYIFYEMLTFCFYDKGYAGWVYKVERSELKEIRDVVYDKRKEFFLNNPHTT